MPPAYALKSDSKFRQSSAVQLEALAAIHARGSESGIVVLPCGAGKTSVFLQIALPCENVLILCYEKQGVKQVANTIREESTVPEERICVCTSDAKKQPNGLGCWMIATYGWTASHRSKAMRKFVTEDVQWDLVILDEVHHVAAATYMPLVKKLAAGSAKRLLGFTGTLIRNAAGPDAASREKAMAELFAFVGPTFYSATCRDLESRGDIAEVRRMEVRTRLTPTFAAAARASDNASTRKYIETVHPGKMNALHMLTQIHRRQGDLGMVFVNHLLHAKQVKAMLGNGWEVLAGSNAHGEDGSHSAEENAEIVDRFNAGKLLGIISTQVGESALDAVHPAFRYAVVVDAHGGPAAASQKLGRLARTARFPRRGDESDVAYRARRLAAQKKAFYYEIVTLDTEEVTAAEHRHAQFLHEGYDRRVDSYKALRKRYKREEFGGALPFASELEQARLLVEALSYTDLGAAAKVGAGHAREHKQLHQQTIRAADKKSKEAKSALFRGKYSDRTKRLRKQSGAVNAKAKAICKEVVKSAPLSAAVVAVLRQIELSPDVLKELGVAAEKPKPLRSEADLAPSDDEDC